MSRVLDASAMLAFLRDEPGADRVLEIIDTAPLMLTVNLAEVATKLVQDGANAEFLDRHLVPFPLRLIQYDDGLAIKTALLEPTTRPFGLSLADRACLALAARWGYPALTSDRKWAEVAHAVGVEVELIR